MISDVVVLYEEWKRTQSKRKFSNIINDYYTSSFQHSGAIITLHSFVDELKYINDFMKKIHD